MVFIDNVTASYFNTQKKLTPKQARWQDFLAKFDFTLRYKLGHANAVANALSHQGISTYLTTMLAATGDIIDAIRSAYLTDPTT